jgi:hypothetical protein
LFVIPARNERTAVILRRGPAAWYHIIQWDTRRDRFSHGAWIKGRIYEDRCDVSPDGRLFVYFVRQQSRAGTPFTHAWTAVSRVPWLHALAVWPQGTTHGGGGRFTDDRALALRGVLRPPLDGFPLGGLRIVQSDGALQQATEDEPDSDWCGRDHRGAMIFSRGGRLFRRAKRTDTLVADFTLLIPAPQSAPEWARRPL